MERLYFWSDTNAYNHLNEQDSSKATTKLRQVQEAARPSNAYRLLMQKRP